MHGNAFNQTGTQFYEMITGMFFSLRNGKHSQTDKGWIVRCKNRTRGFWWWPQICWVQCLQCGECHRLLQTKYIGILWRCWYDFESEKNIQFLLFLFFPNICFYQYLSFVSFMLEIATFRYFEYIILTVNFHVTPAFKMTEIMHLTLVRINTRRKL